MNIYLIQQKANTGYDTYDAAVVAAESQEAARRIHPGNLDHSKRTWDEQKSCWVDSRGERVEFFLTWADHIDQVSVIKIGVAKEEIEAGEILSSFNAG